jgi:hypothetical protein
MPELDRVYGQLDHAHATVIGIAADDQLLAWTASLGNVSEGLPFSVLLDGSGAIRWVHSGGGLTAVAVREHMRGLLRTRAPSGAKEMSP